MSEGAEEESGTPAELQAFVDLGNLLLEEHGVADLMETIVAVAVAAVSEVAEASVSIPAGSRGRLDTATASSPAIELDQRQYRSGIGPSVEAIGSGLELRSELPDGRWPDFSEAAIGLGLRSVWALPLEVRGQISGALNLYSIGAPVWTSESAPVVRLLADRAGTLLANATALARAELANVTLTKALETRTVIGQAQGVLIARQNIRPEEAFDILRRASQRTNRKLREVAAEIVASALNGTAGRDDSEADGTGPDAATPPI
ncbi:MAG TPA: GAF and ANTAR domain-containing protein [Acidimicrobiales bacterium]|nr:GAF and ANTAR domain-containing protein [Acidimicrobiales bacterium]